MKFYKALVVLAISSAVSFPTAVVAQSACSVAYEKAQENKVRGHLNAALSELRVCVDAECPKFIRDDCSRWLDQVESALPGVVFGVRRNGRDLTDVEVRCDGVLLTRSLDGKAITIDPGLRSFSFAVPGLPPVEREVLIREGEHNRIIDVDIGAPDPVVTVPVPESSPVASLDKSSASGRGLTYGLTGVGLMGLAGFSVFALWGQSQQQDLEQSCSPHCDSGTVDSVKLKYALADTCLGVGIVSLGIATYLYFTSHDEPTGSHARSRSTVSFVPRAAGQGGSVLLSTLF